jgi:hypothetical protein
MQIDLYNGYAEARHLGDRFSSPFCPRFLWLSLAGPFPRSCLAFLRSFATQGSLALKDCFIFVLLDFGIHSVPRVPRFHPGRAAITRGLATYSWRAPGIQKAPFATQLPLRHAGLGTVAYTVAWGVPFSRPRNECVHLRARPPRDLSPPPPPPGQGKGLIPGGRGLIHQ